MNRSPHGPLAALFAAIATLTLVIGVLVLVINLVPANADSDALRDPVRVVAEVTHTDVRETGVIFDQETLVTPTVTFTTEDGQEVTTMLAPGRGALSYAVGEFVGVVYERTNPSVAYDDTDSATGRVQIFFSVVAILGALALYVVALLFALVALRNRLVR